MTTTTLHIKNMVCDRCITTVSTALSELGFKVIKTDLGHATIEDNSKIDETLINAMLQKLGFKLITEKKKQVVQDVKTLIVEMVHYTKGGAERLDSTFLSQRLHTNYQSLSKMFSQQEHITIEKYIILQKIEFVKELLSYGDLTLSEIGYQLNYSSVQHLSNQFKSVTGMSVTEFKSLKKNRRKPLDKIID